MNLGSENNLHPFFHCSMARYSSSTSEEEDISESSEVDVGSMQVHPFTSSDSASQPIQSTVQSTVQSTASRSADTVQSTTVQSTGAVHSINAVQSTETVQPALEPKINRPSSSSLMSVLSGNQRKKAKKKDPRLDLSVLENKVYSTSKSVSALELLKKPAPPLPTPDLVVISDEESKESNSEFGNSRNGDSGNFEDSGHSENRNFEDSAISGTSAISANSISSILSRYPTKKKKNQKGVWTLKVCLKLPPHTLRQITTPPSYPVTIKLSPAHLTKATRSLNPLYTSGTYPRVANNASGSGAKNGNGNVNGAKNGNGNGNGAKNGNGNDAPRNGNGGVFAMMMKKASENSHPKLTPIQKLKGLDPPPISRDMMHVTGGTGGTEKSPHSVISHPFTGNTSLQKRIPEKNPKQILEEISSQEYSIFWDSQNIVSGNSNEMISGLTFQALNLDSKPEKKMESVSGNLLKDSVSLSKKTDLSTSISISTYVRTRSPLSASSPPHQAIAQTILENQVQRPALNWPQHFKPHTVASLLIKPAQKHFLSMWFANSFEILRTQSTKVSRSVKLREKKRRRDDFDDFVVNDNYLEWDDSDTDEDSFVPILIIHGHSGAGKTASVYAAIQAINGYVHEINTGHQRSRKDLLSSLKEFCTTQIQNFQAKNQNFQAKNQNHQASQSNQARNQNRNQNQTEKVSKNGTFGSDTFRGPKGNVPKDEAFQKGVVLFEDCDILFEQDKTFWSVVQEVMNFSKRPLVLTVQDLDVVPKSILEVAEDQNSVVSLDVESRPALRQYLWLCSFACGFDLSDRVLENIIRDCSTKTGHLDMRRCLMSCQWLCYKPSRGHMMIDFSKMPYMSSTQPSQPIKTSAVEITDSIDPELFEEQGHVENLHSEPPKEPSEESLEESLEEASHRLEVLSAANVIGTNTHSAILHAEQPNELLDICVIDESSHLKQKTLPYETNLGHVISHSIQNKTNSDSLEEPFTSGPVSEFSFNGMRSLIIEFFGCRAKKLPRYIQDLFGRAQTRNRSDNSFVDEADFQGLPENSMCYSITPGALYVDVVPIARTMARFQESLDSRDAHNVADGTGFSEAQFIGWRRFHRAVNEVLHTAPVP